MRYFKCLSPDYPNFCLGVVYPENYRGYGAPTASSFYSELAPALWEEVIVSEKPKPKTWTKKVALFETCGDIGEVHLIDTEDSLYNKKRPYERISDWVEVAFTEKTDIV